MQIEILGAESLGVRSLACAVNIGGRKVVIDPGVALGFRRYGLLPHPVQVAASEIVKGAIEKALKDATDIVISHYHGDHHPMVNANPYQLSAERVVESCKAAKLWAKGTQDLSPRQANRAKALAQKLNRMLPVSEGVSDGPLTFSAPVPHGKRDADVGTVMMTRIQEGNDVFVHASDIQMLNDEAVEIILEWQPTILLASGPPIYSPNFDLRSQQGIRRRVLQLAQNVNILILDHHLMRSKKGEKWLDNVSSVAQHNIVCAADFMGHPRMLLEAERPFWYKKVPVPEGWHEAYARGEVDMQPYHEMLSNFTVDKG